MATDKRQTSLRLSAQGRALQAALARKFGLTLTAVIELAVRRLAEAEHVTAAPEPSPKRKATAKG